jgi:hypothetical protein
MGVHAVTKKDTAGTLRAKVAAKRKKLTILDFSTARGCDAPTMSLPSNTVNVNCIISALKKFLKALGQKRLDLVPREWIFSGITPQFTLPGKLSRLRLKKKFQLLHQPLFST